MDLEAEFDKYEDEFLKFESIASPLSKRPDLCAFLMLDAILPGTADIITASEHDEYFLGIDCEQLAEKATTEQIRDLVRCGIRYSSEFECLAMLA